MQRTNRLTFIFSILIILIFTGVGFGHAAENEPSITIPQIEITGEHVKQWIGTALNWLLDAIIWLFKFIMGLISIITSFMGDLIIILVQGIMRFIKTIFELLNQ